MSQPLQAAPPLNPLGCREWFDAAGQALERHAIHDAGSQRIAWYPHLRATRWLAAIRPRPGDRDAGRFWLQRLADEAEQGWQAELQRLPGPALEPADGEQRLDRMRACIRVLLPTTDPGRVPALEIPDAYSQWRRILGIYPVTRLLATPSVKSYREDMLERFDRDTDSDRFHYLPPVFNGTPPRPDALAHNALEMPWPTQGAAMAMLSHYAPVVSVADDDPANQPGTVGLSNGTPQGLPMGATAYTWISWQSFRDRPVLQLNYQFWFSQRPKTGWLDGYGGTLDGLIWRVTLKPDGHVLFYDSIHPCGCYHKIYPVDPNLKPADMKGDKPVLYPGTVADARDQRVSLLLEPDTHYLVQVGRVDDSLPVTPYSFASADRLRALPQPDGRIGSLFNGKGLVPVSKRGERFYLWPMGIPSAGAMRQPGEHAIAFKGRRHFDEAKLAEALFE